MARPTQEPRAYRDLGRRIAAARNAAGFTQRALADAVHISPGYVPHIEGGRARPEPDILRRIADATGTDYNELAIIAGYIRTGDVGESVEVRGAGRKAALLRRLADLPEHVLASALDFIGAVGGGVDVRKEHDGDGSDHDAEQEGDNQPPTDRRGNP